MSATSLPFAVGARITRADIPELCAGLVSLVRGQAGGVVVCDVRAVQRPDVVTVEALARLRLSARRHGWQFSVRGARPELLDLLGLMGLSDALDVGDPP